MVLVKGHERAITIEKWVGGAAQERAGATATRGSIARAQTPVLSQTVVVTRLDDSFRFDGAPLVLEFQLLFLRPPGPGEADVRIGELELGYLGDYYWRMLA